MTQSLMLFSHQTCHGSAIGRSTAFVSGIFRTIPSSKICVLAPHSQAYTSNCKENLQLWLYTNKNSTETDKLWNYCIEIIIVLCNVFTPTRKTLDFRHASQKRETHKYTKEDEDICIAVVQSICLMALMHLLYFAEIQALRYTHKCRHHNYHNEELQ